MVFIKFELYLIYITDKMYLQIKKIDKFKFSKTKGKKKLTVHKHKL